MYIDQLDDIVNKYNNRTIKMKPVAVKSNTYINSSKEVNDQDAKCKIGNFIRISKYKNMFTNWSEEVFSIKKVKNTELWTSAISALKGKETVETF